MTETKEVKPEERALTEEEKAEVAAYQATKAREEQLEKLSKQTSQPKSGNDLLEECYPKLTVLDATLKTEIEVYFYESGRWETPVVPDPVTEEVEINPLPVKTETKK